MKTRKKVNELVGHIEDQIDYMLENGLGDLDKISFKNEEGVLLSVNQAKTVLEFIKLYQLIDKIKQS